MGKQGEIPGFAAGEPEVKVTGGTSSGKDSAVKNTSVRVGNRKEILSGGLTILFALALCITAVLQMAGFAEPPLWFISIAGAYVGAERVVTWRKK